MRLYGNVQLVPCRQHIDPNTGKWAQRDWDVYNINLDGDDSYVGRVKEVRLENGRVKTYAIREDGTMDHCCYQPVHPARLERFFCPRYEVHVEGIGRVVLSTDEMEARTEYQIRCSNSGSPAQRIYGREVTLTLNGRPIAQFNPEYEESYL